MYVISRALEFQALKNVGTSSDTTVPTLPVDLGADLACVFDPHLTSSSPYHPLSSSICLNALMSLSWHTRESGSAALRTNPIWRRDILELCIYRWMSRASSLGNSVDFSTQVLFHMTLLTILSNISIIYKFARSQVSHRKHECEARRAVRDWHQSDDCGAAIWHATELITLTKQHTIFSLSSDVRGHDSAAPTKRRSFQEAPHVAICVYSATLVLWSVAYSQDQPDLDMSRFSLESGIHILSCLNVRMAEMLANVLKHLGSSSSE